MGGSVFVTPSAQESAATTLRGHAQYVSVPSRRVSRTGTVDVGKMPSREAVEQLRQRLREAS